MDGLVGRLIAGLVMAAAALGAAWAALALGLPLAVAVALALAFFVALVVVVVTLAMRHDVKLLKNHALELTGYESEINRRVDYLATIVEREGGATPDELAKRMRGLAHEFAALAERVERLEARPAAPAVASSEPAPARAVEPPLEHPAEPRLPMIRTGDDAGTGEIVARVGGVRPGITAHVAPPRAREPVRGGVEPAAPAATPPAPAPRAPAPRAPAPPPPPPIAPSARLREIEEERPAVAPGMRKVVDARTHRPPMPKAPPSQAPPPTTRPAQAPSLKASPQSAARAPLSADELRRALASSDLVFHLVPILSLPERRPDFYEAIHRLRRPDGTWLEPEPLLAAAREHALQSLVERKTLYSAARMLRAVKAMGKQMRLFAGLSVDSLTDERGFRELRTFLEASGDLSDGLILEVSQSRFRALPSEARQRLGLVVDAGFTLSMGDVRDPDVDVATLRQLGFRHARARTGLLLGEPDPGGADSLALRLSTHRVGLIAVGAENEEAVLALIDRDVGHAQGPALSGPRVVKDELLRGPAVPARVSLAS